VLASKFRNLHLWGCWWYCNNPSVVTSCTQLRLELLGPNFTFQASSARVHDQLVYKWVHARAVLEVVTCRYTCCGEVSKLGQPTTKHVQRVFLF